jgi:hypothetical protein
MPRDVIELHLSALMHVIAITLDELEIAQRPNLNRPQIASEIDAIKLPRVS